MYNNKYINDFDEETYLKYLSNKDLLKEIADCYINQFNSPTYDNTLAFKESLDHFILKNIKINPEFIKSNYFHNYLKYIHYIFSNRKSCANTQLEYNTNIVFTDESVKEKILSLYNRELRDTIKNTISNNEKRIDYVLKRLKKKDKLSQGEINFIGEYLYTRRDLDSDLYKYFIEYIMNDAKNNTQIKNSPQIMAAFIAYLPKVFGDGCEDCRIILTNGITTNDKYILPSIINSIKKDSKRESLINKGFYSHENKFISIAKNELDFSLVSEKFLDNPDNVDEKDLFWIIISCFRELTHQYQVKQINSDSFNSSGFSVIIRNLVNYEKDYSFDKGSYEMKIEADDNAWKKLYNLINDFMLNSSDDKNHVLEMMEKCKYNQSTILSRNHCLSNKQTNISDNYFSQDMTIIFNNLKSNSKYKEYFKNIWNTYPMIRKLFSIDGRIKTSLLLNETINKNDIDSLENNIMCGEVSEFLFTYGYGSIKKHIKEDKISEEQIKNLMLNIHTIYELNKLQLQSLLKVDSKQHDKNINLREKCLEKFKMVANIVFKEREIAFILKNRYPQYDVNKYCDSKYAVWSYTDMLKYLYEASNNVINNDDVKDVLAKFEISGDSVLLELAKQTRYYLASDQSNSGYYLAKRKMND